MGKVVYFDVERSRLREGGRLTEEGYFALQAYIRWRQTDPNGQAKAYAERMKAKEDKKLKRVKSRAPVPATDPTDLAKA